MSYYYAPVHTDDETGAVSPGSVETIYVPAVIDPETGEAGPGDPVIQWGPALPAGQYYHDATTPRFVVRSVEPQTYSDWTEVTVAQIVADYGSEVV